MAHRRSSVPCDDIVVKVPGADTRVLSAAEAIVVTVVAPARRPEPARKELAGIDRVEVDTSTSPTRAASV